MAQPIGRLLHTAAIALEKVDGAASRVHELPPNSAADALERLPSAVQPGIVAITCFDTNPPVGRLIQIFASCYGS